MAHMKKGKKQMISCSNYYGCRRCKWHDASCKDTYLSPEQATGGIGLQLDINKGEYMCFTQNGGSLKLVDKFICLDSSILSTKSDVNMHLAHSAGAVEYTDCFSVEG